METSLWKRLLVTLRRRKFGILLAFGLTMLCAPFIYRSSRLVGLPDIGAPFDTEKFGTIEIADEENAFVEYKRASLTRVFIDVDIDVDEVIEQGWSAATPAMRKWLDDNRDALELLKAGSKKPKALIGQPKDQSYSTMIGFGKHIALSQLARLEAARLRDAGDVAGAWEWYRVAFRHSRHIGMYDGFINRSAGVAFHATASKRIVEWSADPRIGSSLLRQALDNVIFDYQLTQPRSTTLRSEYFFWMNGINDSETLEAISGSTFADVPDFVVRCVLFLKNEPETGNRVIKLTYANWLSQVDLPRHLQSRRWPGQIGLFEHVAGAPLPGELSPAEIEYYFSKSPVADYEVGRGPPLVSSIIRERTRQSQLVVALTAQLYFRDNGRFPNTSAEFLDGYLNKWPIDHYIHDETPMHYRFDIKTGKATVWSVGPNGINDGGNVETHWNDGHFDLGVTIRAPSDSDTP